MVSPVHNNLLHHMDKDVVAVGECDLVALQLSKAVEVHSSVVRYVLLYM